MHKQIQHRTQISGRRLTIQLLALCLGLLPAFTSFTAAATLAAPAPVTLTHAANAQDPVTGAFEGTVTSSAGGPVAGAVVQFINVTTQVPVAKRTDSNGKFYQGLLQPGTYRIRVSAPGYQTKIVEQRLFATRGYDVVPVPVVLTPDAPKPAAAGPDPKPTPTPAPVVITSTSTSEVNAVDGRRSGGYSEDEVVTLPTGDTTFTRTFDSFALLIPGIALPPQTQGRVAGPGIGAGVGSAGQFSANGLRSRGNNFLVDGSDNNDEDIGVRRQGFFTLVPQSMETIREYQVITALAPAQFGRNLGATVNALSKSGGSATHGAVYGFLNTSKLNAREFFDTTSAGTPQALQAIVNNVARPVRINGNAVTVRNPAAGKDSLTFGNVGFMLGGPLLEAPRADVTGNSGGGKSAFYLMSLEGMTLNANKELSFAVPTVEDRGFARSGARGLTSGQQIGFPTSAQGDAVFSLYPFANNPTGIYGRNTYTQILPASAQGYIGSLKGDYNFQAWGRDQSMTARYNQTQDWRNIPGTGGGLYATLRPKVKTQNFSFFWNGELTGAGATTPFFNQFRASYGRTRLNFEEERDRENLIGSQILPDLPFSINAPLLENFTLPSDNFVDYRNRGYSTELGRPVNNGFGSIRGGALGIVGQILMPGYSPLGADVYNFPQRRVNNTYQLADILSFRTGGHSVALGGEYRRIQLNSFQPRNSRPQLVFGGAPLLNFENNQFFLSGFSRPDSLAAVQAASGFFQTLTSAPLTLGLRYSQYAGFAQDEWRVRPNFSLSYGLRYEYNTPPSEVNQLIERTFNDPALNLPQVAGLKQFLAGRTKIYDPDRNNFAPRVGFALGKDWGENRQMVVRGGYGLFYDQVIGAVVSQSRNVFPTNLTINTGGGLGGAGNALDAFDLFNPSLSLPGNGFSNGVTVNGVFQPYVVTGTLNTYNRNIPLNSLVSILSGEFPGGFGFTLPDRKLRTPLAHQYSLTLEQQLGRHVVVSAAYVGTRGRSLLRLTTPNLGPNLNMITSPLLLEITDSGIPTITGLILGPGANIPRGTQLNVTGGRPVPTAGAVFLYSSAARSRYDALQTQLRAQFSKLNFQLNYTWSKVMDDASDVFDLAGTPALPQNSLRPSEYALANFDARHRVAYHGIWTLPSLQGSSRLARALAGGFEIVTTGQFQTGQPFTVNSINDINLDGNFTDRLRTANGIQVNRSGPNILSIANDRNFADFWSPIGTDGAVGRNTFRGSNYLLLNLGVVKNFVITETQRIILRADAFNFTNRANFALPVRYLEAPSFGQATDTVTPGRRIQFGLKYLF